MTLTARRREHAYDLGLLVLRVGASALMMRHGLAKLERWESLLTEFSDPIGLGPAVSLALAIFAELFCSIAIAVGVLTRFAVVPALVTMLVAALIVHADDPWARKELPLLYAAVYVALGLLGAGRYSVDGAVRASRSIRVRSGA